MLLAQFVYSWITEDVHILILPNLSYVVVYLLSCWDAYTQTMSEKGGAWDISDVTIEWMTLNVTEQTMGLSNYIWICAWLLRLIGFWPELQRFETVLHAMRWWSAGELSLSRRMVGFPSKSPTPTILSELINEMRIIWYLHSDEFCTVYSQSVIIK